MNALLRCSLTALSAAVGYAALAAAAAPDAVLGYDDARHLLARTGFGPSDAEVRAYAELTRDAAVARLLRETRTVALTPPPASALDTTPLRPPRGDSTPVEERQAFVRQQVREGLELRGWWIREMLATPSPLTERMTLFWHNHFASGQPKVRISRLMYRQNVTLRAHALGNFGDLLHAIGKDPAMLVYLDGVQSRKGAPNENFAREVMELFTLGEGRYTEQDVKEAARAFTGWSVNRETGDFVARPFLHDDGVKTVFGKSARYDGDGLLDLLLARPETAAHVVTRLWREFISPDPDPAEIRRLAARFRESGYDIRMVMRELLLCDAFYARENRGVLVRSPVELVVGSLRSLDLSTDQGLPFAIAAAGMGQNLLSPPNVKGWPGGETWINTTTLLARKQFADRLTRADGMPSPMASMSIATTSAPGGDGGTDGMAASGTPVRAREAIPVDEKARQQRFARQMERGLASLHFDSARWMAQFPGATAAERARWAQRLLLATEPQRPPDFDADSLSLVHGLMQDAAYQLK